MPSMTIDHQAVPFHPGESIMQAALRANVYIPHLCYHPEFVAHGSCRVCVVKVNGRYQSSCTLPAEEKMQVENHSDEVQSHRRSLLELLFVEGNHVCPSCEKSGACSLQSVAEFCGMLSPPYRFQYPNRQVDASHPDFILELNRCINCELCVRASRDVDKKNVFSITGRGAGSKLIINSKDGTLGHSRFAATDRAASVCPVGAILPKQRAFADPIGHREFDKTPIEQQQVQSDDA